MSVRPEKLAAATSIRENFEKAISSVLVDFTGLDVPSDTELRNQFRAAGIEYKVVKNNIVRKALEGSEVNLEGLEPHLKGMTGIAWSYEDPSTAAKIIKAFRKENQDKLQVKCGLLEGEIFDGAAVESKLATLPGKDEIRAMLLAQLNAPMQSLVRQLAAPAQNFAYLLDAKKRADEGAA